MIQDMAPKEPTAEFATSMTSGLNARGHRFGKCHSSAGFVAGHAATQSIPSCGSAPCAALLS